MSASGHPTTIPQAAGGQRPENWLPMTCSQGQSLFLWRLYVIRGTPEAVFQRILSSYDVASVHWEVDTEPYAKKRDVAITEMAKNADVDVLTESSHTLYDVYE